MSDLKPCPSCREPMDHPSGDGCANMTAHKEKAVTDEELIARLRDAVNGEHDMTPHGADVLQAADRIEALIEESGRRLALARSEGVARVEQFERTESLTEQLTAARQDAKEAEDYAEELERDRRKTYEALLLVSRLHSEVEAKLAKAVEALTPSGDTKAEYMSEFSFSQTMIGEDGDDVTVKTYVPWGTIKEIMAAILARTALAEIKGESHE